MLNKNVITNKFCYIQDFTRNDSVQTDKILSSDQSKPLSVIDKVPELLSLSSVSGATPTNITSNNAVTPLECNKIFKKMSSDVIAERQNNKESIISFVKDELFKRLKFYNAELLIYNTKKSSICQKVCNHLNMAEAGRVSFWSKYSPCVESAIRVARNDAVQAMKNTFFGGKFTKRKVLSNILYELNTFIFI